LGENPAQNFDAPGLLAGTWSAYYAWLKRKPSKRSLEDKAIARELIRLHSKYPTLGLDPLYQMLKPIFGCSRKRVHRLKKRAGIYSVRHKAYRVTTNSKHNNPIAPNLIGRKPKATKPNQIWVSDITYIPTGEGWLYFAVIKDLYLKKVVGYSYSDRINTQLVLDALKMAVYRQRPKPGLIFHSDRSVCLLRKHGLWPPAFLPVRGVQYSSAATRQFLLSYGFKQSMTRKGDPYENAVAENFFSCLKCECVHLCHFATRDAAKLAVFSYIETFYNRIRPHSGIGWLSPSAFERMTMKSQMQFEVSLGIAV
jgi:transposase InsO family protein